ncbi:hypothetical protein [Persicobacter diffluens]|uniref:Uncharacterized protein n=1 Tax=Persicobacter diffluens TaxID=981 RepID=A0AAN4VWE1_9BACT|nr:hypothetical protein PEDI_17730 [Persicobacter diffluens]
MAEVISGYSLQGLNHNTKLYLDTYIPFRRYLHLEFSYFDPWEEVLNGRVVYWKSQVDTSYYWAIDDLEAEIREGIALDSAGEFDY